MDTPGASRVPVGAHLNPAGVKVLVSSRQVTHWIRSVSSCVLMVREIRNCLEKVSLGSAAIGLQGRHLPCKRLTWV